MLLSLKLQIWYLLWAWSSLSFRQTIEYGSTLKLVCDMITYTQMHRTDKYSQHRSIIWPVWLTGWVFVYELSSCGFESCCCHLNFRYGACFLFMVSCTLLGVCLKPCRIQWIFIKKFSDMLFLIVSVPWNKMEPPITRWTQQTTQKSKNSEETACNTIAQ